MSDIRLTRTIEVEKLNELLRENPEKVIRKAEAEFEEGFSKAVDRLLSADKGRKIVLLSGPSASGKTTFAGKLCEALNEKGREARQVSLDDFYLGLDYLPKNEDGTYDMESIRGLDLKQVQTCLSELLSDGFSRFPTFDFPRQKRSERWNNVSLSGNGILVIEGIYALYPILGETIPGENTFRISIRPEKDYLCRGEKNFTAKEVRLMRRMIRDGKFRSWPEEKTLEQWESVRRGERIYVDPFRERADLILDTSFNYEPAIYRTILSPILEKVKEQSPSFSMAQDILKKLSDFSSLPLERVPESSLLREFIG